MRRRCGKVSRLRTGDFSMRFDRRFPWDEGSFGRLGQLGMDFAWDDRFRWLCDETWLTAAQNDISDSND